MDPNRRVSSRYRPVGLHDTFNTVLQATDNYEADQISTLPTLSTRDPHCPRKLRKGVPAYPRSTQFLTSAISTERAGHNRHGNRARDGPIDELSKP